MLIPEKYQPQVKRLCTISNAEGVEEAIQVVRLMLENARKSDDLHQMQTLGAVIINLQKLKDAFAKLAKEQTQ